jgi:SRSO17 transposase
MAGNWLKLSGSEGHEGCNGSWEMPIGMRKLFVMSCGLMWSSSWGGEQGILVVDETGFVKKGKKSAGVARQYSGTAGRRENCQIGVFLLYASGRGTAFLDRRLYLPEEWTQDRVRCREAGVPEAVQFATKGELAKHMLVQAFAAGAEAEWVGADTVYGYDEMRDWLESRQQ